MGAHAGRRTTASGAAAAAAGLVVLLACVVGPVTGFAPARGAALAGGLQLRSREPCVSRNSVGLLRQRAKDRTRLARRLVRRTTAVQATPAEETAKPAEELASEALRQTVVVEASMDHCFNVASNLDAYRQWCAKGGMKQVEVLLRNDDNLATKVKLTAGKLGVDMLNTMEYSYDYPRQVLFKSVEGDVMKKLEGRYIFEPVADAPHKTSVTYELDLEFGFPLPGMVRTQICGAIMRTALNAFKSHTETLSRS